MFFELVGTIVAGIAAGLLFWAVNRTLKGRLPSWLGPVCAGSAMLLSAISLEYGWYDRTVRAMPAGLVVAQTVEEKAFYRPWTYAVPFTSRYIAVDQASTRTHPNHPEQRIVDLWFYGRWARPDKAPMLFDCSKNRSAIIIDGVEFGADGEVVGAQWMEMETTDPVLQTACAEV